MRIALVTNIPAPYRIPIYNILGDTLKNDFIVFYCSSIEPDRSWTLPEMTFQHIFLKENYILKKDRSVIHNNRDIVKQILKFKPTIVITSGFNPTMLYAFVTAKLKGYKHISVSDAWFGSEGHIGKAGQLLRKFIYRRSDALLPCSKKGREYFEAYGCKKEDIFISHIAIEPESYRNNLGFEQRPYHLLFSGRFIERKKPAFFVELVRLLKNKIPDLKVLVLGDGPLKHEMLDGLSETGVDFDYPGFARQDELPFYYSQCKIFAFPTGYDAWGVVAHESLAAGTPVITTPLAGCADDLVLHNTNGFIMGLDAEKWAEACLQLLNNENNWNRFAEKAREIAGSFNSQEAAEHMLAAFRHISH